MKNFPVLLKFIAGCGLLALAACDDKDPSGGDNPPQTEFTITATAITPRGATVSVSPKNRTGAYYFDVVSDKVLRENYGGDFEACFKSGLQQYIDRYAATLTPEEVLTAISSTGAASYTYQWLGDNTKYYILAAGITTAEPGTTTKVEYSEFETLPLIKNEFTFSDITPTDLSVKATVSSADPELRYVTYLVEKEEFDATGLSPEAYVDKTNQELIAYATGLGVTLEDAIEAMSESGVSEFSQNKLAPAVDFLLIAAGINSEGYVITECASREVRTADPRKSDMTFEFQVSDLSPTGAVIKYIPSVKNDRYFYDIAESKELEGLTDEQIMAKRIELAGSYIGFYTTYDDYENDMRSYLDPDTEYVALAFGYISYITTGLFRSEPFSTPASQYGQDFGECTSGYYGDRYQTGKDNWRLALVAADKSYTLSLNCLADAVTGAAAGIPAGEYTFSADGAQGAFSILPDGSNVTNKSDQSSSAVKSGKLTVAYEGSACIIAADITDSEGNNVKGSFRGSVAATDYTAYPAIGQIVSAQVSFYGGGNWFINLYDYPLEGSSNSYRLTFDLYVSTETSPSAAGGLPEGTYDVVATGLGIRSNKDTKVEFASKQLCTIESGQMTVARNGDEYTISFKGSCPLTDIDISYTGALKVNDLTRSAPAKNAGEGIGAKMPGTGSPMTKKQSATASREEPCKPRTRIPDNGVGLRHFDL